VGRSLRGEGSGTDVRRARRVSVWLLRRAGCAGGAILRTSAWIDWGQLSTSGGCLAGMVGGERGEGAMTFLTRYGVGAMRRREAVEQWLWRRGGVARPEGLAGRSWISWREGFGPKLGG